MKYNKTVTIKDGRECILRNGDEADGQIVYDLFVETHAETDFLLSYPEENSYTAEEESNFLKEMTDSENGIEIIAVVDGKAVGCAGIEPVGKKYKVKHRAEFGISVLRDYWYLGIGSALTAACIECAKEAGFEQLELNAVAENEHALALYRKYGFEEFGRNPKGFKSKITGDQEVVYMRLELK